jgi:lipid II:glycine glycyltransferase (peptidoglycan interpeptide bridge formation enzyme)
MFMEFEHKVRKNVNRARRTGLSVVADDGERLNEFLEVYRHTMDRRDASTRYYFLRDYFERLATNLAGQFKYFHVLHERRVISTELVLVSADSVYSFLGGTREEAFEHRPNDLLKVSIIEWAREQGKQHFVLGGGYRENDGIFRYKLAFAPNGAVPFFTGRRILNAAAYERLVARRLEAAAAGNEVVRPDFFPAYRA